MRITEKERAWVQENYPKLQIRSSRETEVVEGIFEFMAAYNAANREYLINPTDIDNPKVIVIHDQYEIRVSIQPQMDELPKVQETAGRIKSVAKEKGIPEIDLHIYSNNSLCLVGALDENETVTLPDFMDGHVLQFFYDQSYFERYGQWPRGQYSHGVLGVFENYLDRRQNSIGDSLEACLSILKKSRHWSGIKSILLRKEGFKGHWLCPCGYRKRFRDCHYNAFQGIWRLQSDLDKYPSAEEMM